MRKGAKRKASQKKEAETAQDKHQEPKKATSRAKRVKTSVPESEPEYFEDKRNLVYDCFLVLTCKFNKICEASFALPPCASTGCLSFDLW